ncbi:MAG: response regulator [bacterium]|nr:response regulator [bacterium]
MHKVLIVDDEDVYCDYLSQILIRDGHQVQTASEAREGIQLGRDFKPDLLITDWLLGDDLTGLLIARTLRRVNPQLRTIVITGHLSADLERTLPPDEVLSILRKPFGIADFLNAVEDALNH